MNKKPKNKLEKGVIIMNEKTVQQNLPKKKRGLLLGEKFAAMWREELNRKIKIKANNLKKIEAQNKKKNT